MTGCNNKRRFSLKYPDGSIERFGSCDPKIDDGRIIDHGRGDITGLNPSFYLAQSQTGFQFTFEGPLPNGTLWTNGYYDHEHDGWKPLSEWR